MLRIIIVLAITFPALADAQARSFRFSFRPRPSSFASRPVLHPVERKAQSPSSSALVVTSRDRRETAPPPAPVRSILDQRAGGAAATAAYAPPAVARVTAQPAIDRSAHWCDNGAIVGSGQGFCVLNVKADGPT